MPALGPRPILIAAFAWLCFGTALLRAGDDLPPQQMLKEKYGLVHHGEKLWLLPRELELRDRLAELPKRREKIVLVEKELDTRIEQNQRAWQENQPAIAALKKSLSRLGSNDPERALVQRQIDALQTASVEPRRLAGVGDVRQRAIELSGERYAIFAAVFWIRQALPILKDEYERLSQDAEVSAALAKAGGGQRLGPLRSYDADARRLADYERLAASAWVPIFLQSGQTRLAALADEEHTVTCTWSESSHVPLVLTASAAEALELEITGPQESVELDENRRVAARRAVVKSLRVGACVLRDVPAYVLPPESEDLGCWLGRSVLVKQRLRLEPEKLRLWVER